MPCIFDNIELSLLPALGDTPGVWIFASATSTCVADGPWMTGRIVTRATRLICTRPAFDALAGAIGPRSAKHCVANWMAWSRTCMYELPELLARSRRQRREAV